MAERSYNIALTATDGFSGAFDRLRREFGAVEGAAMQLRTVIGGLAGAFSVGIFAGAIRDAIDYADELGKLAQRTGIAVETLGGLGYAADLAGVNMEQIARSSRNLAQNMAEAAGGNKEAMRAFEALGMSVKNADGSLKSIDVALAEIADKFASYADGPEKAALAQEIFKKGGEELIPLLNQGGESLRALVEEFNRYGGVSTETAKRAETFNDTLTKIQMISGALFREIASALLPTLQALLDEFVSLKASGDGFKTVAEGIAGAIKVLGVAATGVVAVFKSLGSSIASVVGALVQAVQGNFGQAWEILKQGGADVITSISDAITSASNIWNAETATIAAATETNIGQKTRAPIVKMTEDIKKAKEETLKLGSALKTIEAPPAFKDLRDLTRDTVLEIQGQTSAIVRQAETLGLTTVELIDYEIAQLEARKATQLLTGDVEKINAAYDEQIKALRLLRDANQRQDFLREQQAAAKATADEWQRTADSIRDSLTDALLRGFESGKDFAKNLRDTLVNMFKTLVLRPIIQGVLAPVSGGLSSMFGGLGGGGGGGGFGNLLGGGFGGGFGSMFSGIEGMPGFVGPLMPGTFGAGLGSFFTGMASPFATLGAGFSSLFGGGGIGGSLAAMGGIAGLAGAALPVIGIGLAIASALGAFERGGPKAGGSASSLADLAAGTTGLGTLERLFTPNQRDSDVQKVTDSIATSFLSVARSLGIAGGTAQFGLGFDTDPEGDAGNRVSAVATLNGQTVYQVTDRDLGRDGDVTAALEEEAKRALFAALQASDMPAYLANLFDGIDAAGATAEQIDGILQTAAALKIAVDAISGLGDQFAALDPADVQGFVEAFGGLEGLLQRVAYIGENFYTDAERLAQATTRLEESFDALGIAVPQTHQAFLALLNGLDLTTAEGREMYEAISALAPLFVEVRGTAQQAADALEDAAGALDEVAQAASNIIDLGSLSGTVYGEANSAIARIIDLAGTLGGSIGEQLTAQINLANGEIQRYIALWQQAQPGSAESQALLEIIGILQQFNQGTAAALAQYTSIVAQYGSEYADAIYQLQQQYWQQTQLFQGNTQALSALAIWYNEQLQAILEGTAEGVTGTISELDRLRESLQDYLAGLSLRSDLSPLSPAARLAEAQRQYQDLLARSQGGDVDALRDLQGAADAYLRIAREMFASGADYTNIFQSVVDALSVLSAPPQTGGPEPRPDALIAAALPTDSRLASQDDIEWLAAQVIAAIREGSREQADATVRGSERVAIASRPLK